VNSAGIQVDTDTNIPLAEIRWQFTRSSGPGGQNVNKTATRVELLLDVANSPSLDEVQKALICSRLAGLIDRQGVLHLISQTSASQWQNRADALARLSELLAQALRPRRTRLRTRPSRGEKQRRRRSKARRSETKRRRRAPAPDDW